MLAFRNENDKMARKTGCSSGSFNSTPRSEAQMQTGGAELLPSVTFSKYPLEVRCASVPSIEDQAVSSFFNDFVVSPCNKSSTPGFLEHLPGLFNEVRPEGRLALRWAVLAAGYASLSKEHHGSRFSDLALNCYGRALSGLGKSLADSHISPDDYVLMTVVVLDLSEVCYDIIIGLQTCNRRLGSPSTRPGLTRVPRRGHGPHFATSWARSIPWASWVEPVSPFVPSVGKHFSTVRALAQLSRLAL